MSTEDFTHPVCPHCHSTEVSSSANCRYNAKENRWELGDTYDGGYCDTCDEEVKFFEWFPTPYEVSSQKTPNGIYVSMNILKESNGRITYMVIINRNGNQIECEHSQRKNRTEYGLARWKHLLLDGPEPDLMDYQDDPAHIEIPYR